MAERVRSDSGFAAPLAALLALGMCGLGIGILCLSQWHARTASYGRRSLALSAAAENGLKTGFADLVERLRSAGAWREIAPERVDELRAAAAPGSDGLAEEAFGTSFPLAREGEWETWLWRSSAEPGLRTVADAPGYFIATFDLPVRSTGRLRAFAPSRPAVLESEIAIAAGFLPLPMVPLHVASPAAGGGGEEFLAVNGIRIARPEGSPVRPAPLIREASLVPDGSLPLVEKALKIRIFRPQDLTPDKLRPALGLEPGTDPVPDGVYLARDDLGLGGVFVRGDLDELVAAIDGDTQVLDFRMDAGEWVLRFSPAAGRTSLRSPSGAEEFSGVPNGIVIVDGAVAAFGGGVAGGDGRAVLSPDPVPAVLSSVRLTIMCSGRVTIATHLVLQGVTWRDGVPYLRDSQAQVIVFSTGREVAGGESPEAGIVIGAGGPDGIKIQASLAARGAGLTIEGRGRTVELLGSLAADGYASGGNALTLVPDQRMAGGGGEPGLAPAAASPLLALVRFRTLAWKER